MILDEIVSIKKVGIKKTIDISVTGDNLFLCNGILTHNSGSGDVADVTEEQVQGGISKIQAADNVLAILPNASTRDAGMMRMKILKSRDSSGVGKYINFQAHWSTLSFIPFEKDEDENITHDENRKSNIPKINNTTENDINVKPTELRRNKKQIILSEDNSVESKNNNENINSAAAIVKGIKGKNKQPFKKIIGNGANKVKGI